MKQYLTIILIILSILVQAQDSIKIDSVFNRNFYILEIELYGSKSFESDKVIFFTEFILDNGEKVYSNIYLGEAIDFFQNLSKIPAPIKHTAQTMSAYVDEKTLKLWREWYKQNRRKLKWCEKNNTVYKKSDQ